MRIPRLFSIVCAALCFSVSIAQVKLIARSAGLPDSAVTYFHKLTGDGNKVASMTLELAANSGRNVKVRTERTYAKDGSPIRIFQETIGQKPSFRNSITVTFNQDGAHAIIDEGGKRSVKDYPLAPTAPRKCVSEFWFLRDLPKPGQTEKYYHFDPSKLEWLIVESTYVGSTTVKIGGKPVAGHRIQSQNGESIIDDKGLPLKITYPNVAMTRIL